MPQRVPIGENKANAAPEAENPARKLLQKEKWVEEQPEKHTVVERVGKLNKGR